MESINIERHGKDVTDLMNIAVQAQVNKTLESLEDFGNRIFNAKIANMIYPDARILVDAHRAAGHTIVLASSATLPQVESAAEDLGIDHIVCTELELVDGEFTGRLASPVRWGEEKANGVREFAEEYGIDLKESFCYSNGAEDVPFLELAGHPRPLNPDEDLVAYAKKKKWPIARFKMPHRHNPITVARSLTAIGALGFGVAAGATTALINSDRRVGMAVAASVGSDLALATAGVKLNVVGEEHLWSNRPCVFLFNHQSQLDMLLLGALLRRDFTAVARRNSNTTRYSRRLDIWQASPTSTVRTARKHAKHSSQLLRHCGKADRSRSRQKEHARPASPAALQEGRIPYGDAGWRSSGADCHAQCRRHHASAFARDLQWDRGRRCPQANQFQGLDHEEHRAPGREGSPALPRHDGSLARQ